MTSTIIPEDIHEPMPFESRVEVKLEPPCNTDASPSTMKGSQPTQIGASINQEVNAQSTSPSTVVSCSNSTNGASHQHILTNADQPGCMGEAQVTSSSPTTQPAVEGDVKQPESSGDGSAQAAAHPTSQAHHSHYAQYYHSYPHGHASYYYPHGAYYPPPPPHGHSSYPHASHHAAHYYAHYPPPPGYYAHPHYHYYSHPPPAATPSSSDVSTTKSVSTSSSPTNSNFSANESTVSSKSPTPPTAAVRTPSLAPPSVKGPYSAFTSTTATVKNTKSKTLEPKPSPKAPKSSPTTPAAAVATAISTPTAAVATATTMKNKRKHTPETDTIFRVNNKRTKQLAAQSKAAAAAIAAKRAQTREQAQQELSKTVLDRRSRKNAQSRLRAAKLKQRIAEIQGKDPKERTPEEVSALAVFEERRQRKNGRSRERAMERKKEYERIVKISEDQWTKEEKSFIQETMVAKFKKNEGDRHRRKKLKEEGDSTGSISSGWDTSSSCKGTSSIESFSSKKKLKQTKRKTKSSNNEIPTFIQSANEGDKIYETDIDHQAFLQKDVPLTPLTQKEAFSLLESSPTNFFASTEDPSKNAADCFSPNFIFPSPGGKTKDLSAHMDVIDFDALELHTDGTSILDPSMAMTIDDELIYSPHLCAPTLHDSESTNPQHAIPQLSSNIRLSPLSLPRRSRNQMNDDDNLTPGPMSHGLPVEEYAAHDDFSGLDGFASKAIAVSFSVDTA